MKYPSINISGNIISSDILEKIQEGAADIQGQQLKDFGLQKGPLKEEINTAYAMAQAQWKIFQTSLSRLEEKDRATTETRNRWIVPFLGFLGYEVELRKKADVLSGKTYAISHKAIVPADFPIHIASVKDSLDKKREQGGTRMSPHALVQEYLNITEHLYALVTNGKVIRLLRDSSRLVKLTYLEFDLEQMMEEGHTADFALLFRLLHASRMPRSEEEGDESLLEAYHQKALENGSAIRAGLSRSVEQSIVKLGNGFLQNPDNQALRDALQRGELSHEAYYQQLLRLIYRLLFLFVIEERKLVYPKAIDLRKQDIYYRFYSLSRLRMLSEKRYLADQAHQDLWIALRQTFRLFKARKYGQPLLIQPLAGELFGDQALPHLEQSELKNRVLLEVLKDLNQFYEAETQQYIRVNYAALNVEEFGSVYENLLEKSPEVKFDVNNSSSWRFLLVKGDERSSSGSHYTPDELVKPLIQHSLDHLIEEKLNISKDPDIQAPALLSLKVCDVACGSGHILLAAARTIGRALAMVRTGEDQPSPEPLRKAIRDVIQHCIYGVDKNPLAVELCKVALWLEAHNPGEPLNFLDHHIKCGDAIVGLARPEELKRGIPTEAFKNLPGDDKEVSKWLRDKNNKEVKDREKEKQSIQLFEHKVGETLSEIIEQFQEIADMPEDDPVKIKAKASKYNKWQRSAGYKRIKYLCDLQTAAFFLPKTEENKADFLTDANYQRMLRGMNLHDTGGSPVERAEQESENRRFFHWFLAFPEVFMRAAPQAKVNPSQSNLFGGNGSNQLSMNIGKEKQMAQVSSEGRGFDCILGNPPFLGGLKLSTHFGTRYMKYLHSNYEGARGTTDLVAYFFRRISKIIKNRGFQSLISTNTIAQGDTREGGLAYILEKGSSINFAIRSMKWPGLAAVEVALVTIHKGVWEKEFILDGKKVDQITSYLDSSIPLPDPEKLKANENLSFIGSFVLGKGFVLEPEEAQALIQQNPQNAEVIYPYLNGSDLNTEADGAPTRYVINFHDWPLRRYSLEEWQQLPQEEQREVEKRVEEEKSLVYAPPKYEKKVAADYPDCLKRLEELVKPERERMLQEKLNNNKNPNSRDYKVVEFWWQYEAKRPTLYRTIAPLERVLVVNRHTKICQFNIYDNTLVYSDATCVSSIDSFEKIGTIFSNFHDVWSWKNSSTMGASTLRYSPSGAFETFPFQISKENFDTRELSIVLFTHRKDLFIKIQLGLTNTYNQFHNHHLLPSSGHFWGSVQEAELLARQLGELESAELSKSYGKDTALLVKHIASIQGTSFRPRDPHAILRGEEDIYRKDVAPVPAATLAEAIHGIWELRRLHAEMDEAVLMAYGWDRAQPAFPGGLDARGVYQDPGYEQPIALRHGFYEVDYLPENDRIRFTIHPEARKEVLRRLLLLNHARYAEEVRQGLHEKKGAKANPGKGKKKGTEKNLFNP